MILPKVVDILGFCIARKIIESWGEPAQAQKLILQTKTPSVNLLDAKIINLSENACLGETLNLKFNLQHWNKKQSKWYLI